MTWFRTVPAMAQTALALTAGGAAAAALWLVGLHHLAWVGFVAAGIWWARPRSASETSAGPTAPAQRTPPPGATADAFLPAAFTDVPAGTYDVVAAGTTVQVRSKKLRYWSVQATLSPVAGTIRVGASAESFQATASVLAATFRSGIPQRDMHVIGPQFLHAQGHPYLRYTGQGVRVLGPHLVESEGQLSVRGVTRTVTWRVRDIRRLPDASTFCFRATTTVSRTAFGVSGYRWLAADEVEVRADVTVTDPARHA